MDYKADFNRWWQNEFKAIRFPQEGTVFDYYIEPTTYKWVPWTTRTPKFELDPDSPLQVSITFLKALWQSMIWLLTF